jgi:predicted RNase H-like HicB family nuclease
LVLGWAYGAAFGEDLTQFFSFEIVIKKEPAAEGYLAYSPGLPGCFSNGRTIEETERNMREAITQHVTTLRARGETIPQNDAGCPARDSRSLR